MVRDFPEQDCQGPIPAPQNLSQQERSPGCCRGFLERASSWGGGGCVTARTERKPDSEQRNYSLITELVISNYYYGH